MFRLERLSSEPVLIPNRDNEWERAAVFNAAVIDKDGCINLFYRASNNKFVLNTQKPMAENKFVSTIGHAISHDGTNFKRFSKPAIRANTEQEAWGIEDPRISFIDGTYYMLYTGFGGRSWDDFRISIAYSKDLERWNGHAVLLDEPDKDAALLPEKIDGNFVLFHRRMPDIWVAYSKDLNVWEGHKIIMSPVKGTWEGKKIGIAGPPIKRDDGWLLIYHAVDDKNVYRLGAALLSLKDPSIVIARQKEPILEPELSWEKEGLVPNVVFSCGAVEHDNKYYVYYGAADRCIGVAAIDIDKAIF